MFSFFSFESTKAATTSLTVSQAIQQQNNAIQAVEGYVVGKPTSATSVITSNYPDDYSLAIADSSSETNTSNMLYVQIPSQFRSQFGLKSNPELKGEKIKVTGNLTAYYSHPGLKNTSEMIHLTADGGTGEGGYAGTYYDQAIGKSGSTLKTALHNIIDDHTEISYSNVWEALRNTDEDPNNANNVILLYTGRSQSKYSNGSGVDNWNREHVWAKSHGDFGTTMGAGTDLHHLRPTDVSVNSSRGNKDFDNGGSLQGEAPDTYTDSDSWEPRDEVKGDVARMIFYMDVRYEGDSGELDLEVNNVVNNGTSPYHGKLSTLLQWHNQDPVDNFERNRNEVIYNEYQHNRNPFIDHPEWVEAIWN
ncbi:endonuclease [Metabacillus sediminilitoris]|uniref:Ribonuclease n=1 Tax=Metabacillus sediminilitoris TaxID=2567941 RepID=A0A4S4BZ24_9BACI|nr:endonuclease [Metabacillus sediminilitoris]QGQ48729.1 ribonuclease [Metabacillus sediminilitoris]THF79835.1 ribonuclease [Metabacillus sediminilitoris]